jgi:NADPH:quinone reductase-like Zn-dependent oxidoreductase
MKAITCTEYGSPDRPKITETPKPTPGDNEVLVKVLASCPNSGNLASATGVPLPG